MKKIIYLIPLFYLSFHIEIIAQFTGGSASPTVGLISQSNTYNNFLLGPAYYGRNGKIQKERKLSGSGTGCIRYYDEKGVLTSKEYYKNNTLDKKINYQLNEKGKVVEIKPEKVKSVKQKKTAKQKSSDSKEKKVKGKKQKTPKVKIQKYREIVPGGIGT